MSACARGPERRQNFRWGIQERATLRILKAPRSFCFRLDGDGLLRHALDRRVDFFVVDLVERLEDFGGVRRLLRRVLAAHDLRERRRPRLRSDALSGLRLASRTVPSSARRRRSSVGDAPATATRARRRARERRSGCGAGRATAESTGARARAVMRPARAIDARGLPERAIACAPRRRAPREPQPAMSLSLT